VKIRLLKHTAAPAVPDSGSYEVRFSWRTREHIFLWGRQSRPPIHHPCAEQRGSRAQGEGSGADWAG